ncbi:signal peptidase I [Candidatus Parcubacteria bacterium]|nr:signal peptidase I [Candidatus Parcubacteria bacterium]
MKKFLIFVLELVKIVVISLVIIIPVRYFLIQPFYVKGASMEPNFFDHEYLIINEISYRFNEKERGDIVVFRYPRNPQEYFIKRLIALPGEEIKIDDGKVIIYNKENPDGFILEESYLGEGIITNAVNNDRVKIDEDEIFVLGDNRLHSKDSRVFGPVNKSFVIGKVMLRGWPFNRAKFFETPEYSY